MHFIQAYLETSLIHFDYVIQSCPPIHNATQVQTITLDRVENTYIVIALNVKHLFYFPTKVL